MRIIPARRSGSFGMKVLRKRFPLFPLLFMLICPGLPAAEPGTAISSDMLDSKIKEIEAATGMEEALRARLTEIYRKALSHLETEHSSQNASAEFKQAQQNAAAEADAIRAEIAATVSKPVLDSLEVSDASPVEEIEQRLLKEKANRSAVAAKLSELRDQLAIEAERPTVIREEISQITRRKEARDAALAAPPPADEPLSVTEARKWVLQAEGRALSAQLKMLDEELLSQPMRIQLLKARRDQAALALDRIDARVQALEKLLSSKRLSEAEKARTETEQAVREASGKHPLVQELARDNALLSEQLRTLAADLEAVTAEEASASARAQRIEDEFRSTRQKLELAGLSQALGQVLLEQRRSLPDARLISRRAAALEPEIAEAGLRLMRDEEERRHLDSLSGYLDRLTDPYLEDDAAQLRSELAELAEVRRVLLDKAIATDQFLVRALGELDVARRHLVNVVSDYRTFLNERLLWIRSSPAPSLPMLMAIPEQFAQLIDPHSWSRLLAVVADEMPESPYLLLGMLLFAILMWKKHHLRVLLRLTGSRLGNVRNDRFIYTFQALILTLLLAAPWPVLLASLGWQLSLSLQAEGFSKAIADGLLWVATTGFYLEALRMLCLPGGLAATHFRWPDRSLRQLRRGVASLMLTMLPAGFVALTVITIESQTMGGGLGRLAFVIVLIALAVFFYRMFDPARGVLRPYMDHNPHSPLTRLRYVWLTLAVAVPVLLAGMAMFGYLYTAGTLTRSFIDTLWLILVLVVVQQLAIRWLLLSRRRLALQAALERREAALRSRADDDLVIGSESVSGQIEEPIVDLKALSTDSRKLLNLVIDIIGIVGIWLIWSGVLPAFAIFDDITLWHRAAVVAGQEQLVPVTLADTGLAVLVLILTVIATQRSPALLEISLLQHLKMSPGGRYATTTLTRYAIVALGVLLAFSSLGVSWSSVQWLVAALGVGIGFGLQEIVANFISGIIILFERPIRVGDTVTVGETDGVVTRIQIRATTIRNWDGKELLVPNKEFITSRLLNWTLSDPLSRIVIPVGLTYGSDVTRAMQLLLEAAVENAEVLDDPHPSVIFDAFGDNSLSLKLRCFVGSMDYRIETVSSLHEAINQKFNAAGLVIAFPQQDVHLDTTRPLDIRIRRERLDAAPDAQ
ncbi:MAG: mechanosensitive ion channel [Thiogranum sp.]|nr:mechanosensitive ion channel [Thiogranum sp.]